MAISQTYFLNRFIHYSWIILLLVSLIQCIIWSTWANLFANVIVIFSWGLVTLFLLRLDIIKNYSLSFFLIFGFSLTQYYFPPFFTLIEGKPLVFNLNVPFSVFLHALAALSVMIFSHLVYRFTLSGTLPKARKVLLKAGLFKPPTNIQVWLMGFIGLTAMYYVFFYAPSANVEIEGWFNKLIQGLAPFSYAPFFLPLSKLYGRDKRISKKLILALGVFFILLLAVSIGRNSRGSFMLGLAAVGFGYVLGLFLGYYSSKIMSWKNIFLIGFGVWLITGPLADLGTAMVIVRSQRDTVSSTKLLKETLEAYSDKHRIQQYQRILNSKVAGWDETYLDNIFLARFSNLKYSDLSLALSYEISQDNTSVYKYSIDRFWATFPSPLLSYAELDIDKKEVSSSSFGDYLYYQTGSPDHVLGGRRTGHFFGTGMAAFGWWYLVIMGFALIPLFFLIDSLLLILKPVNRGYYSRNSKVIISFCGLIPLTSIFMFFPTESIINIFSFIIREWIQIVFLYLLIFHITLGATQLAGSFLKVQKS